MASPKTDGEHAEAGGEECPYCRSPAILYDAPEYEDRELIEIVDNTTASVPMRCLDCNGEWNDILKLHGWSPVS